MKKFTGKTAIVTGATSGMGRAIALRFAAEGAAVVAGGRDEARGRAVEAELRARGVPAAFVAGDVALPATAARLVEAALALAGRVDILVPNAGILGIGSVREASAETWQRTLDVNLGSVFHLVRAAVPHMGKGGAIVVNGSIAAFRAFPNHPAYCASKGALVALVRQLALDLAPDIRVNLLCPGQVDTPLLWDSAKAFPDPATAVKAAEERIPLKRLGTPEDIASAALFLASGEASWITGTSLVIDGGLTAGG